MTLQQSVRDRLTREIAVSISVRASPWNRNYLYYALL